MAQITYRGNLSAKVFPFISEYFGRTVIINGPDQNFSRQLASPEDPDKDIGIPQMYYGHNIMPVSGGFQSIGYVERINSKLSGFENHFTLRESSGAEVFFSHTTSGDNYILISGASDWLKINTIAGTVGVLVTSATINGQSYLYFAGIGCYIYDSGTQTLLPVTLDGLDETLVSGITSSSGYMIAWTETAVAWSSTISPASPTGPIDFIPSLVTGAGGGNVEAAKGKITFCTTHYLGFIIYTTDNAVASVASGNIRFPFNLREIVSSGGISDPSLVSFDANSGNHYAYTTSGLQLISVSQTQTVLSDVTDFISGGYFEDFNENTLEFSSSVLTAPMVKAIQVVADRYLIVSYGIISFTHAIVLDLVQKRFGKLRINHTAVFDWKQLSFSAVDTPRASIGFMQADGSLKTVEFSYGYASSSGVMLLGKFQYVRARLIQLQQASFENIRVGNSFSVSNKLTLDGKTVTSTTAGYEVPSVGICKTYNFNLTGLNHSLVLKGNFYITSFELKFNIHGSR